VPQELRAENVAQLAEALPGGVRGVRLFEYQPAILHAKTHLVDDHVSVVGSSNLDFRSSYFNAECNVLILDDETGQTMAQAFQKDLEQSAEVRPGNMEAALHGAPVR
jgi:cardiolipin synthase